MNLTHDGGTQILAIQYELARDGRVLWQTFTDPVDMVEVAVHSTKMLRAYFDPATKPIHTISDFSQITKLPSNIISGSVNLVNNSHPMSGELILITKNRFVTLMARVFIQSAPNTKISLCRTLNEAWKIIDQLLEEEQTAV